MASPADGSESPRTLPRPELNPLLNPLLGNNMGRWAEVYFTSAPEKREEAVIELLRELEAQSANGGRSPAPLQVATATPAEPKVPVSDDTTLQYTRNQLRPCDTCGHANTVTHQFCGMCGSPLAGAAAATETARTNAVHDIQTRHLERAEAPAHAEFNDDYRESIEERPLASEEGSAPDLYDLSPFQNLREKEYAAGQEDEEAPWVRYRSYIAAVLAILILALGYTAWRVTRTDPNAKGGAALASPPAADGASAAAKSTATPTPAETSKHLEAATPSAFTSLASPPPSSGGGAEELAMAQRYLSGANGQVRDPAEGAKWLWKSISKHNGPAVIALADLYLNGDGVSKNCDQARVLLDSAAQRGTAGAGERLRNLQAFGCQ